MRHKFWNLEIWKRARVFVKEVYLMTQKFPKSEQFGLTAQMRDATISIPSNIAEGCGRRTHPQFVHFLDVAIASNCEIETQIYIAFDLGYTQEEEMKRMANEAIEIRRVTIKFQEKFL